MVFTILREIFAIWCFYVAGKLWDKSTNVCKVIGSGLLFFWEIIKAKCLITIKNLNRMGKSALAEYQKMMYLLQINMVQCSHVF